MTKYELKMKKKLERHNSRLERKEKRKDKREARKFKKLSNSKYRLHQRILVRMLRIGGPILGFGYAGYRMYDSLFVNIHSGEVVDGLDLKVASMLLVAGVVLFGFALWYGFKWLKTAITANAVARNEGKPSLHYSPIVVTIIRAVLASWLFGLLYLFNYIGVNYGEALHNGFEHAFIAFCIGFGFLLTGDVVEQSMLHKIRNRKHEAEHKTRQMIYEMNKENE